MTLEEFDKAAKEGLPVIAYSPDAPVIDNQTVLTKVIEKLLTNGYKPDGIDNVTSFKVTIRNGQTWVRWFNNEGQEVIQDIEHVLFDHRAAKALWGENPKTEATYYIGTPKPNKLGLPHPESDTTVETYLWHNWQYHLQQLAISEDRIAYLKDNAGIK